MSMTRILKSRPVQSTWWHSTTCMMALTAGALAFANPAAAQDVTLDSHDGVISIQGKLIEYDDVHFIVEGDLGRMKVARRDVVCNGAGCPAEEKVEVASANGRQVVLKAIDGDTQVVGDLVTIEPKHYIIRNMLGEFRIAIANVECHGNACPNVEFYDPQFAIHGATPAVSSMMAEMLRGFAAAKGHEFELEEDNGVPQIARMYDTTNGRELVAEVNLVIADFQKSVNALSEQSVDISVLDEAAIQLSGEALPDGLAQTLLAYDGQVIVANRDNPVRNLDLNEIKGILSGDLENWKPLGAGDFPISVHMVSDAKDDGRAKLWLSSTAGASADGITRHATEAEVIAAVEADRNAIGLVNRSSATLQHARMMGLRKSCGLTAQPTDFDMRINHYPLTHAVYAFGREAGMHPVAGEFMDWAQSSEAQGYTSRAGYASTKLQRMKIQDMGVAVVHTAAVEPDFSGPEFSAMMRELRTADRLSITFRFRPGSASLDDVSVRNVQDLVRRLRQSEFDGQEVMLVGFADSVGPAGRNSVLSTRRAKTVQDLLTAELSPSELERFNVAAMGYGEQMPLDCNDTDAGRSNNRRVEVWVRVAS